LPYGVDECCGNPTLFCQIKADLLVIHTQKRDPATHLSGDDDATMFWDYLSQNPESIHQVMILMGDRGIPKGKSHLDL
jgi:catalase